jgi:hypothetical protein
MQHPLKDFDCRCGNLMQVPSPEVVCELIRKLGFSGEITLKQNCSKCDRPHHTSYDTQNSVDKDNGLSV